MSSRWPQLARNVSRVTSSVVNNAKVLDHSQIPGPKNYPFLGPLNEMITMGKAEK